MVHLPYSLPNEANAGIAGIGQDRSAVCGKTAGDRIRVGNDVLIVESVDPILPGKRADERVPEINHDPSEIDSEILHDNETDNDRAHTDTF